MSILRKLDLNLLVVFEAIYSAGNVTHAASSLGVTQPTVSNALTRLRTAMDDPLFVRKGKGVEPTPKAMSMIGVVREALGMIENTMSEGQEFDPTRSKRHFRVMMLDQLEPLLMPALVGKVQGARGVTLEMLPFAQGPLIEGLNEGSLDLVLSPHLPNLKNCESEVIGEARVVVVARKGHPFIEGELTLQNFEQIGQIALSPTLRATTRLDEFLQHRGIERHIAYTAAKFWSFPHMIATSDLIGVLPGDFAREAANYYPLELYPLPFDLSEQQIYMYWKNNRQGDVGLYWLRGQIAAINQVMYEKE